MARGYIFTYYNTMYTVQLVHTHRYFFLSHNIFIFTNTLYNSAFIYFEKGFFYKSFYKIMFMGSANLRKRLNNKAPESINKGQF